MAKKNDAPVKKIEDKKTPKSIDKMIHDDDDVVTLITENGQEIDFIEIAGIAYRGNFYAILQPAELLEGMADDEAFVFRVSTGKNGEDVFDPETDDSIIESVFKEYEKLYNEAIAKSKSKKN